MQTKETRTNISQKKQLPNGSLLRQFSLSSPMRYYLTVYYLGTASNRMFTNFYANTTISFCLWYERILHVDLFRIRATIFHRRHSYALLESRYSGTFDAQGHLRPDGGFFALFGPSWDEDVPRSVFVWFFSGAGGSVVPADIISFAPPGGLDGLTKSLSEPIVDAAEPPVCSSSTDAALRRAPSPEKTLREVLGTSSGRTFTTVQTQVVSSVQSG